MTYVHENPIERHAQEFAEHLLSDLRAVEAENERLREALELTYKSIDNLCARPGTCMAVRPRLAARTEEPDNPESPCSVCGSYGHFTHNHLRDTA